MVMVADLLPGLKPFLSSAGLRDAALQMVLRIVITFILHSGRMSCLQAAGAVRSDVRHRAQVGRFLRRPCRLRLNLNDHLRRCFLERESARGRFLFLLDATFCSQAGKRTENTYSTGNHRRRPRQDRRYGRHKQARKSGHSFTMGLLITPSGVRLPFSRPYYTRVSTVFSRIERTARRPKRRPT